MINTTRFTRQNGLIPPEKLANLHINLIGTGAVGSFSALALAKMGVGSIKAWDDDRVEEHNLSVQFFANDSLGKTKVEALGEMLDMLTTCKFIGIPKRYEGQEPLEGITISAVDSIPKRHEIFKYIKQNSNIPLYVDTRMGAYTGKILSFNPNNVEKWQDYLKNHMPPRSQVAPEPCTERSILFTVLGISSEVGAIIRKYVLERPVPYIIHRDFKGSVAHVID